MHIKDPSCIAMRSGSSHSYALSAYIRSWAHILQPHHFVDTQACSTFKSQIYDLRRECKTHSAGSRKDCASCVWKKQHSTGGLRINGGPYTRMQSVVASSGKLHPAFEATSGWTGGRFSHKTDSWLSSTSDFR